MLWAEAVEFLRDTRNETIIIEARKSPAAVVLAPGLVGRVMCSTFDRKQGEAHAWINEAACRKGKVDPVFNNFGGEERLFFAPEGGQFGLMFGRKESRFENYCVQAGMNSLDYQLVSRDDHSALIQADMTLDNYTGTRFKLHVDRRVTLLEVCPFTLEVDHPVELVAFQSENTVTNVGPDPWTRKNGTVAMWCLGQLLEHPRLTIVVPTQPRTHPRLPPPTVDEYFKDFCVGGTFPSNRRASFDDFVLLFADGRVRCKVGVKKQRATGRLGSFEPDTCHLVLVDHDFYPELDYVSGYWRYCKDPYDGDALSIYIDGPDQADGPQGTCYELETVSPALFLRPRESFSYRSRTFHIRGDREDVGSICRRFLRADLAQIEEFARKAS